MGTPNELDVEAEIGARNCRRARARLCRLDTIHRAVYIIVTCVTASFLYRFICPTRSVSVMWEGDADWWTLPVGTVKWWSCGETPRLPRAECGVPTDYHNPSAGVTKVALGRFNATKSPRKGMVIFGAGGPGGPGAYIVTTGGQGIQAAVTGEHYDIVGIDQRGIGDTEPGTQCFSPGQSWQLKMNTVLNKGFDFAGNMSHSQLRPGLLRQQIEADALARTHYAMCGATMGQKIRYMGTTTVVRDINFITTALEGKDALINYYGGSYGSVLGQYLVNIFPDRVGKIAIEGIVDSAAWADEPNYKAYRQWLSSTEDAYDWFLDECAKAGPNGCELASEVNEDPVMIRTRLEALFDGLYAKPIAVATKRFWGTVTSGMARTLLFRLLQMPTLWPTTAVTFSEAMRGDGQAMLFLNSVFEGYRDMERQAVSCNDAFIPPPSDAPTNEQVVDEMLSVSAEVTKFSFSVLTAEPDSGCQYWPVTPPERFTGPWNHTLRNPILVMSNTADPVTPISSARLVKEHLGDCAVLVLQNGPGHGTTSVPTVCTINKCRAYFTEGTFPEDGHVCELERSLFPLRGQDLHAYTVEENVMVEAALALDALVKGYRGTISSLY